MSGAGLAAAVTAGLALAYAVEEGRRLVSRRRFRFVGRGQAVRRVVGSVMVAALMVLVFLGLEIDAFQFPDRFLLVWFMASLLVVVLLGLAWLDLRELRAHRDIARAREILRFHRDLPGRGVETNTDEGHER